MLARLAIEERQADDRREKAMIRMLEGRCLWQLGQYDSAYQAFLFSLNLAQETSDSLLEALSWQGLASVSWRMGNYDQALDYQLNNYGIVDRLQAPLAKTDAYLWLGIIHADLRLYDDALRYYRQGTAIAEAYEDSLFLGQFWNMIGRAYRKQELYDSARMAHERSIQYFQTIGDFLGVSDYYNNVGSIFRREGQYDSAVAYFERALVIQVALEDLEGMADGYNDLGTTYSQMGRPELAFAYLREGLAVARATGLRDDVRYAYASLAATYDSLRDYRNALNYYRLESRLADSLLQEEIERRTDLLTTVAENKRHEAEILALQLAEKQREVRTRLIIQVAGGIVLMMLLVVGFLFWRTRIRRRQALELGNKNRQIEREKQRSEELLLNILPASIAEEMMAKGKATPRELAHVTVMFIDFVGFSRYASGRQPREIVSDLQVCFEAFDRIMKEFNLEKIKTIGDAYMCAGGVPEPRDGHELDMIRAAHRIQEFMKGWIESQKAHGEPHFQARVGIHSGPVVAGVVGLHKFTYDIWGNTVNIASRMESNGEPGRVNISQTTYDLVREDVICRPRGRISAKNIGEINMYFADFVIG